MRIFDPPERALITANVKTSIYHNFEDTLTRTKTFCTKKLHNKLDYVFLIYQTDYYETWVQVNLVAWYY